MQDAEAIEQYEEHVRFMILAEHELSGEPPDVFDSHLNLEQINKVLTMWEQTGVTCLRMCIRCAWPITAFLGSVWMFSTATSA